MKDKKTIIIIVLVIISLYLGGHLIYDKNFSNKNNNEVVNNNKDNSTSNDSKNDKDNTSTDTYQIVSNGFSGINVIKNTNDDIDTENGDPLELVEKVTLPKIVKETDVTKKINQKILDDNNSAIESVKKGLQNEDDPYVLFDVTTSYDYTIHDDILYILVTTKTTYYRSHGWTTYQGYYYDIQNDKELSLSDIMKKLNIKSSNFKSDEKIISIMYLNTYNQAQVYYKYEDECFLGECINNKVIDLK